MRKERLFGIISLIIVTAIALSVTLVMANGVEGQLPSVEITSPQEGATVDGTVMVQGNASDADGNETLQQVEVRIDDGAWHTADGNTSWTYSWDTATVQDGSHTIEARSYDGGNYSDVAQVNVTVDNVDVVLSVTRNGTLGRNGWYTSNVSVTIEAVENTSRYNYTNYSVDDGPWRTYNGSFNLTSDGVHTISYYAVDVNGTRGELRTHQVKIDATPPVIECHLDPETPGGRNGWYVGKVEVTLNTTDNQSGVNQTEYQDVRDGNSTIWKDYTGLFPLDSQGNHTFMFRVTDKAGHTNTGSRQIKIDHTAPAVEVLAPTSEYVTGTVAVSWNASDRIDGNLSNAINISLLAEDNTSIPVASNLSNAGTYSWNTNAFAGGVYRLQVNATDDAGNVGSNTSSQFTLDNQPPAITIEQPKQGQTLGGEDENLEVIWNATDNIAPAENLTIWISYREAEGDSWYLVNMSLPLTNTGETSIDVSTWDDGQYQLRINATDDAGNTGWDISSNFTIDTTKPNISLVTPQTDYLYLNFLGREIIPPIPIGLVPLPFNTVIVGQMTVEVDASDAVSDIERIDFRVNGKLRYTGTSSTWTWDEKSYGGTYTLSVVAEDTAGNKEEAMLTDIVYINI